MAERIISAWGQLLSMRPQLASAYSLGTERRAWVRMPCDLTTTYQLTHKSDGGRLPARVQNICAGGINVLVERSLEPGTVLSVELPGAAERPSCTVLACVMHCTPLPTEGWAIGCALVTELDDEELQPLGAKRLRSDASDQRKWVRFTCDVQATYRRIRMTERERRPARVIDISAGGLNLLVADPVDGGTLLSLQLQGSSEQPAQTMLACVVRVAADPTGQWVLGCTFMRELTGRELEALNLGKSGKRRH
jgi:hypothetical protein